MNISQKTENASHIITPPDYLDNDNLKVLLVDVDPDDLVQMQLLVSGVDLGVDLYLFGDRHEDSGWLDRVSAQADSILINLDDPDHRLLKKALLADPKTFHIGQAPDETRQVASAVEYLARLINERKQSI